MLTPLLTFGFRADIRRDGISTKGLPRGVLSTEAEEVQLLTPCGRCKRSLFSAQPGRVIIRFVARQLCPSENLLSYVEVGVAGGIVFIVRSNSESRATQSGWRLASWQKIDNKTTSVRDAMEARWYCSLLSQTSYCKIKTLGMLDSVIIRGFVRLGLDLSHDIVG